MEYVSGSRITVVIGTTPIDCDPAGTLTINVPKKQGVFTHYSLESVTHESVAERALVEAAVAYRKIYMTANKIYDGLSAHMNLMDFIDLVIEERKSIPADPTIHLTEVVEGAEKLLRENHYFTMANELRDALNAASPLMTLPIRPPDK